MKRASFFASLFVSALVLSSGAHANKIFSLVASKPTPTCAPNATGRVTVAPSGKGDKLHVEISGLAPKTAFELFILQVPKAPFGMSWYQGDVTTDGNGLGVGDFAGIFSVETFTVAPGSAPAPLVFPTDASSNPLTAPIQMYHIGLWFNSPTDAVAAGCPNTVTPFNGTHNAGVQVLNSSNFPDLNGPLRSVK